MNEDIIRDKKFSTQISYYDHVARTFEKKLVPDAWEPTTASIEDF
jgi:hypothetical protein